MKVGSLIRVVIPEDVKEHEPDAEAYLMQVIEVAKIGLSVIILSGPHMGREHFYPHESNREWEVISE